jgi:hypothetical protein
MRGQIRVVAWALEEQKMLERQEIFLSSTMAIPVPWPT